jgi:hypothetical protein
MPAKKRKRAEAPASGETSAAGGKNPRRQGKARAAASVAARCIPILSDSDARPEARAAVAEAFQGLSAMVCGTSEPCGEFARTLEEALFGIARGYDVRYRHGVATAFFVLQNNHHLCEGSVEAVVSACAAAERDVLATPAQAGRAAAMAEIIAILSPAEDIGEGGEKCRRCKSRNVRITLKQTRSGDEPERQTFDCGDCAHQWHVG